MTIEDLMGKPLSAWRRASRDGRLDSATIIKHLHAIGRGDPAWISLATEEQIHQQFLQLEAKLQESPDGEAPPLYGIPFAVKDNIDVATYPTTAACKTRQTVASQDARVVSLLRDAGAVVIGKTNMDQFATGLVGTRSPYGIVPSCFDSRMIGGGSSSGSASVVARGVVPFALGTDTAGSGRVPAALQNIVGYKPTRGRFSTRGVLPACRTLDCVSLFAQTVADCAEIATFVGHYDAQDPYARRPPDGDAPALPARPRLGVPAPLEFFSDSVAAQAFTETLSALEALGFLLQPVDFSPFSKLARLLYEGPWVVERLFAATPQLSQSPDSLDDSVRTILERAQGLSAERVFLAEYERANLARQIEERLGTVDALIVPTTPTTYTIAQVLADPLGTNSRLGTYTNFTNLADLAALALPGRFRSDLLPAGVTLLGTAWTEPRLVELGRRIEAGLGQQPGVPA